MIHEQDLGQENVDWIKRVVVRVIPAAKVAMKRGEKKGHPFHGNRYTGGIKASK
jgi:hypothetical protein